MRPFDVQTNPQSGSTLAYCQRKIVIVQGLSWVEENGHLIIPYLKTLTQCLLQVVLAVDIGMSVGGSVLGMPVLRIPVLGVSVVGISVLGILVLGISVLGISVLGMSVLGMSVLGLSVTEVH